MRLRTINRTKLQRMSRAACGLVMVTLTACLVGGCAYEVSFSAARSLHVRHLTSRKGVVNVLGFIGELVAIQIGRDVQVINARTGRTVWKTTGRGKVAEWAGRLLIEEDGRCARVFEFDSHDTAREIFCLKRGRLVVAEFGGAGQFIRTDGTVWRLPLGQLIGRLPEGFPPNAVRTFSDSGRLMAWQDADHVLRVWDIPKGREVFRRSIKRALGRLVFGPKTEYLVLHTPPSPVMAYKAAAYRGPRPTIVVRPGRVEVVNLRSGELAWSKPIRRVNFLLTGDRRFVLRPVGKGQTTEVLRIADGGLVATIDGRILSSPAGTARVVVIAQIGPEGKPYLRHIVLPSGRILTERPMQTGWNAAVSPKGRLIAIRTRHEWVVETIKEGEKLLAVRRSAWAEHGHGVFGGLHFHYHGCYLALVAGEDVLLFDLVGAHYGWVWPTSEPKKSVKK